MAFQDDLAQYRSAVILLKHDHSGSALHAEAAKIVTNLGPRIYDMNIVCILCGATYTEAATMTQIASWVLKPRGICGKHHVGNKPKTLEEICDESSRHDA